MLQFLLVFVMCVPLFAGAAVQREIQGVKYYLADGFDTADGECVLRGKEYASSFYSMSSKPFPVAILKPDGKVLQLIKTGTKQYPIIDGIECE